MGCVSTAGNTEATKSYERCDAGVYAGRCIAVIDLGTQRNEYKGEVKWRKEIHITWELSELMQDGRPFVVSWRGTNSLNEKGNLFKMLSSWRGKPFTPAELHKFEMKNILDKGCMINVTKDVSKAGKEYNKVVSVMPLPKGMKCEDRVNDLVDFGIDDISTPAFEKLYPFVKNFIKDSKEGQRYFNGIDIEPELKEQDDDGEAF